MKLADIKALPVGDIVAENAALFLWATMPLLPDCLEVIDAWGFKYKTVGFTWVKTNPKSGGYFMGGGSWTRANAELCLLAFKGKMKRISASVRSVVESNLRAHSEKPPEVRGRIVELLGNLPRIELFARKRFGGWHGWGNEVEFNNIELADNEFVWRGKP
jgi:N6-adenosine-specific RNA methylase IME4